ncbi:MAG: hypothetical protein Q9171_000941 [Xanthocarpia ochracea]
MSNSELATSYAALILADDDVEVTPDKLQTLIKAANIDDVESIWTTLFAKALEGKNVKDMLLNVGSGGGAAAAPTGAAGGAAAETAPEEAKEEKKEEGTMSMSVIHNNRANAMSTPRERGVGRRHGFRTIRLEHAPFEGSKRNSHLSIVRMHLAWVHVTFKTFQKLPACVRMSAFEVWLNQNLV